jgi:hypothetical protein
MSFLRKNIVLGVASSVAIGVGMKLWDLSARLQAALGGGDWLGGILGLVCFLVGGALFVWLYVLLDGWLKQWLEP